MLLAWRLNFICFYVPLILSVVQKSIGMHKSGRKSPGAIHIQLPWMLYGTVFTLAGIAGIYEHILKVFLTIWSRKMQEPYISMSTLAQEWENSGPECASPCYVHRTAMCTDITEMTCLLISRNNAYYIFWRQTYPLVSQLYTMFLWKASTHSQAISICIFD